MRNRILLLFVSLFSIIYSFAQNAGVDTTASGGAMASNGKIYVVAAVVLTILLGLIYYVSRLDRKIGKLEKEIR